MVNRNNVLYIIIVLSFVIPVKADITRAYSFYLLQEYDSSLYYYDKVIEADSSITDAWVGKMNCLLYKKDHDAAATAGVTGLAIKESFILHNKLAYVYALKNNDERVVYHYEKALTMTEYERGVTSEDQIIKLMLSIGYGYFYGGQKDAALKWFSKGKEKYNDESEFVTAINSVYESQPPKLNYIFANIHGGIIAYAESNYYDRGYFFSVNPSATIKRQHFLSLGFNQTEINLKNNVPYLYVSKTYNNKSEIPAEELKYVSEDSIYIGGGNYNTVYTSNLPVNSQTYSGQLPLQKGIYNPENLWTKELLLQYKLLYSKIEKTSCIGGIRYSLSNMLYSEKTYTAYIGHFTTINTFSIGGLYHFTSIDSVNLIQISPNISTINNTLNIALQTHGIIRLADVDSVIQWLPPFQLSLDAALSYYGKKTSVSLTVQTGQRAFAIESYGTFFRNSFSPFVLGTKALFEMRPFKFPVTMFYLFSFSKYSEYKSYVNMGGLHLQW